MIRADFFDSKIIEATTTSIVIDNGEIKDISTNNTKGAGIRALCGGSWGFTSVDGDVDLNKSIRTAAELAKQMDSKSSQDKIKMMDIHRPVVQNLPKIKIDPRDISLEEKAELLKEIWKHANIAGISSASAVYKESVVKTIYTDSTGIEAEYEVTRTGFVVQAIATLNGNYQCGYENKIGINGYEIFENHNVFEIAESAAKTALELLDAKQVKGGTMPVILDQDLAGVFTHEAIGHASEADLVLEGSSVLENRIGQQIGSLLVTIIDDPTIPEYGYFPFDDEGTQTEKTVIVKDGTLQSYLHSRETAAKLDGKPGHSRSQGYSNQIVRMSNTYIDNGTTKFEEMLEEIKNGVYLMGSNGGQVNTGEGIFQFNAQKGYLIENGELTGLLRDVSLSGKTLETLNNIKMVGNDLKLHPGTCGKNGQLVPVTHGSPHLLLSQATVGGI
jgi:TldD protein